MSKRDIDKDMLAALDSINEINPYATYLNESTLSSVSEWIDTGSLVLNAQISGSLYGGIPDGRVVQFAGASQTGKSYFIQKIIANAQKAGKTVVIFDSENAIDQESAKGFGIDASKVKYVPALTVENTRNAIMKLLKNAKEKNLDGKLVIVIDSLGNLESELGEKRIDADNNASDMGSLAKAIKSLLKTCTNWGRLTRTPIILTNHIFDNPAEMFPSLEKNMAGGKAAVYLPSVTLQLARKAAKDDGGKTIDADLAASQKSFSGVIIRSLSVKNRFTKQYLEVEMYLSFSRGLDRYYGLLEVMKGMGVVENKGSIYYDWSGNRLGFYKKWRKDVDLWENTLLPELEKRIKSEWTYGNKEGEDFTDEELDGEDEDSDVEVAKTKGKKDKTVLILEDEAPDEE
jgi:RecA/RadA recombinase